MPAPDFSSKSVDHLRIWESEVLCSLCIDFPLVVPNPTLVILVGLGQIPAWKQGFHSTRLDSELPSRISVLNVPY